MLVVLPAQPGRQRESAWHHGCRVNDHVPSYGFVDAEVPQDGQGEEPRGDDAAGDPLRHSLPADGRRQHEARDRGDDEDALNPARDSAEPAFPSTRRNTPRAARTRKSQGGPPWSR